MNFSGKVALVTGAARGIGRSCAEELLKNGVKGVTIVDIDEISGEKAAKELSNAYGSERVIFVQTDVSRKESFENAFKRTVEKFNNIDILINNAGVIDEIEWERVIQVNLIGTTYGCLLAIEHYFPKYKSNIHTYIINISSVAGLVPVEFCPHYTATKHAILGLTRTYGMNRRLKNEDIHVMALCPSGTETVMKEYVGDVLVYKDIHDELRPIYTKYMQKADAVGPVVIQAIKDSESGSAWYISEGIACKVKFPTLDELTECP